MQRLRGDDVEETSIKVKVSDDSDISQPIDEYSSDSQLALDPNRNLAERGEFSISKLESSFDSHSPENQTLNQNFAQEEATRKKSNQRFMIRVMFVFVIFDIAFITFLVRLALTTDIGFITNTSQLN